MKPKPFLTRFFTAAILAVLTLGMVATICVQTFHHSTDGIYTNADRILDLVVVTCFGAAIVGIWLAWFFADRYFRERERRMRAERRAA